MKHQLFAENLCTRFFSLGNQYLLSGDTKRASELFLLALSDETFDLVITGINKCLVLSSDSYHDIQVLTTLYNSYPNNHVIIGALAWSYYNISDFRNAVYYFKRSLGLFADSSEINRGLGVALLDSIIVDSYCPDGSLVQQTQLASNSLDSAINYLSKASHLNPTCPFSLEILGWAQYLLGNYERAKEYLDASLSVSTYNSNLEKLGATLFHLELFDDSYQYLSKANQINPTFFNHYYLALYAIKHEDYDLAFQHLYQFNELEPQWVTCPNMHYVIFKCSEFSFSKRAHFILGKFLLKLNSSSSLSLLCSFTKNINP